MFSSPLIHLICFLLVIGLGNLLLISLKKKNLCPAFLCAALTLAFLTHLLPAQAPAVRPATTVEEQHKLVLEQKAFDQWYNGYTPLLHNIDANWEQYQRLLAELKKGGVAPGDALDHCRALLQTAETLELRLARTKPPAALAPANRALIAAITEDTRRLAAAHCAVFQQSIELLKGKKTARDGALAAGELEKTALLQSPAHLDIMPKLMSLRSNLNYR